VVMVAIMFAVVVAVVVEVEVEVVAEDTVSRGGSDIVKRKNNHQASVQPIETREAIIVEAEFTGTIFPIWIDSVALVHPGNRQGGSVLGGTENHICGLDLSQPELGLASIY